MYVGMILSLGLFVGAALSEAIQDLLINPSLRPKKGLEVRGAAAWISNSQIPSPWFWSLVRRVDAYVYIHVYACVCIYPDMDADL